MMMMIMMTTCTYKKKYVEKKMQTNEIVCDSNGKREEKKCEKNGEVLQSCLLHYLQFCMHVVAAAALAASAAATYRL